MYNILLVDDELPTLRFLDTIIKKNSDSFTVIEKFHDGKSALNWIEENGSDIDILITDIRMPGVDGITLAKTARTLFPSLHIVIVSGYQDFEYAHGAIEASVDDYILKPVSVSHMKELLEKIKGHLDNTKVLKLSDEFSKLLIGKDYNRKIIEKHLGSGNYFFALLRFGNVPYQVTKLHRTNLADTDILSCDNPDICIITGKDDKEFLIYTPVKGAVTTFRNTVKNIADSVDEPHTIITCHTGRDIYSFGSFYHESSKMLRRCAIIGKNSEHILSEDSISKINNILKTTNLKGTTLKQLEHCVLESNLKAIHDIFQTLGHEWDTAQISQRQSYILVQQILHLVQASRHDRTKSTDQIMLETDLLTEYAKNYSELMDELFSILFDGSKIDIHKMTPEDMYNYAMEFLNQNFNQQLSIQTLCSKIGISQTYLSRIFRKYGNTSFNAQLVKCRIENACRLIKEQPSTPLNQIALYVGYEDYTYFSKVFRQVMGCSPSQYLHS